MKVLTSPQQKAIYEAFKENKTQTLAQLRGVYVDKKTLKHVIERFLALKIIKRIDYGKWEWTGKEVE